MGGIIGRMLSSAAVNVTGILVFWAVFTAASSVTTGIAAAEDGNITPPYRAPQRAAMRLAQSRPQLQAYDNYDLTGPEIRSLPEVELPACAAACQSENQCQAFSYDKWRRRCSLRQAAGSFRFEPRAVSGIGAGSPPPVSSQPFVMECFPSTNVAQASSQQVADQSFDQCRAACEKDQECVAFAHSQTTRTCSLFRTVDGMVSDQATVSGVKHQLAASDEKVEICKPPPGAALYSRREQAAPLSVNGAITYTLPANENDFWGRFNLSEQSKVSVVLNWSESAIDLDMELKDDRDRQIGSSAGSGIVEKIEPSSVLEPGGYLVHVYRYRSTGAGAVPIRLSVTQSSAPQYSWAAYDNLDIEGGDFSDMPQGVKFGDEAGCLQRCQDRLPACAGYSYNRWSTACYLKQTLDGTFRRKDPALRTVLRRDLPLPAWYPKAETVTKTAREFRGSELRREDKSNRDQCASSCQADLQCVGYTFTRPSICQLFDRIDSATDSRGTQSGLKQQLPD
jgi:hypothetical protein